jgi:hypothetical protein
MPSLACAGTTVPNTFTLTFTFTGFTVSTTDAAFFAQIPLVDLSKIKTSLTSLDLPTFQT